MVELFVLTSSRFPLRKSEEKSLLLRLERERTVYPLDHSNDEIICLFVCFFHTFSALRARSVANVYGRQSRL